MEKRTNGKVKVEYYPGQTPTKADMIYDGVISGLSDVGFSVLGYTRGRFPLMEVVDLPLGYKNGPRATAVANAVFEKFKDKALNDTEVMYLHARRKRHLPAHSPPRYEVKAKRFKDLRKKEI